MKRRRNIIKKILQKNDYLNLKPKQSYFKQLMQLTLLRLKNIVHRDLKLANILINEQMQIKLADFGVLSLQLILNYCKHIVEHQSQWHPKFQSNLILLENKKKSNYSDYKCDIWSLGVIIYQILFGQPPILALKGTVQDLVKSIQNKKLQFPQNITVSTQKCWWKIKKIELV